MTISQDRLYALLPAIYRLRDAEQGYQLRALLRVIEEQADVVDNDISQLYDNWFIETCEDWVVPYIGDLIGYLPLQDTGEPGDVSSRRDITRNRILIPRRDVANTIRYRRRKGTLALLELLANDIADWPARAVEFYRLLGWTQHLNHQHLLRGRTTNLRDGKSLDCIDGPFDSVAHTVDVRRINSRHMPGRYNIPSVGVFVCRLKSYPVTKTPAFCIDNASPYNYTFSVLGNDTPLFTLPVPEIDPRHIAEEINLPVQIRRRPFEKRDDTDRDDQFSRASDTYYGPDKSLAIWAADWPKKGAVQPISAELVIPADLSEWKYAIPKNHIAVDPVLGRIRFPVQQTPKKGVVVVYHYGFSTDIGGGEYPRPIPGPDLQEVSKLRSIDIRNLEGFAARLDTTDSSHDPVSAYIHDRLSSETQVQLKIPGSDTLSQLLFSDLNKILEDETFYDSLRFKSLEPLPAELALLCNQKPLNQILRRNRLLLETAYPEFIAKSYALYRIGEQEQYKKINDALIHWHDDQPVHAVIEITDSGVYVEQISISLEKGQSLHFRAADAKRPVLRQLNWQTSLPDAISISGGQGSRIALDGLLITGRGICITGPDSTDENVSPDDDLCEVVIRHCTLVPGWSLDSESCPVHANEPSIELMNTRSRVHIEKSIIGPIMVVADDIKAEPNRILIHDSVLDATDAGFDAVSAPDGYIAHAVFSLVRCTVFGKVLTQAIKLAENSIFTGEVKVARSQMGCMRFCYVPHGSRTPRKFSCLPDSLITKDMSDVEKERIRKRIRPYFTSTLYGTPGYCQLTSRCVEEIRHGADDGSEMGVFHDLYLPQREVNLRLRLDEYTPTGMETGIIFVN